MLPPFCWPHRARLATHSVHLSLSSLSPVLKRLVPIEDPRKLTIPVTGEGLELLFESPHPIKEFELRCAWSAYREIGVHLATVPPVTQ